MHSYYGYLIKDAAEGREVRSGKRRKPRLGDRECAGLGRNPFRPGCAGASARGTVCGENSVSYVSVYLYTCTHVDAHICVYTYT